MNSSQPISNEARVNIPRSEYEKLLEYKKICHDMFELFRGEQE